MKIIANQDVIITENLPGVYVNCKINIDLPHARTLDQNYFIDCFIVCEHALDFSECMSINTSIKGVFTKLNEKFDLSRVIGDWDIEIPSRSAQVDVWETTCASIQLKNVRGMIMSYSNVHRMHVQSSDDFFYGDAFVCELGDVKMEFAASFNFTVAKGEINTFSVSGTSKTQNAHSLLVIDHQTIRHMDNPKAIPSRITFKSAIVNGQFNNGQVP